jgi:hypothetical protein
MKTTATVVPVNPAQPHVLPIGHFAGKPLTAIPSSYLQCARRTLADPYFGGQHADLITAVEQELLRRLLEGGSQR